MYWIAAAVTVGMLLTLLAAYLTYLTVVGRDHAELLPQPLHCVIEALPPWYAGPACL
jgi:hypothetical protein